MKYWTVILLLYCPSGSVELFTRADTHNYNEALKVYEDVVDDIRTAHTHGVMGLLFVTMKAFEGLPKEDCLIKDVRLESGPCKPEDHEGGQNAEESKK